MRRAVLGLVALAASASCVGAEIAMIGPRGPVRPAGCPVQIIPGTPAPPVVDVASVRAYCDAMVGRDQCFAELRRQACALGGDIVYGLSESVSGSSNYVAGTVAWRGPSGPGPAANAEGRACTPICSPGFDCQAGRCIPLCNPACGPSEICNGHRTCEPAAAAPASAPAGG